MVYEEFKAALLSAANRSIPLKKKHFKKIPFPPWWDLDGLDAIKKRREAEALLTSSLIREIILITKEWQKKLLNFSLIKRLGWQKFCEILSPKSPPSLVWNGIKLFRGVLSSDLLISFNDYSEMVESFAPK